MIYLQWSLTNVATSRDRVYSPITHLAKFQFLFAEIIFGHKHQQF